MEKNDVLHRFEEQREAVRRYLRSAERGDAAAQYSLGNCCFRGEGIERDESKAFEWFLKSAEQGYVMAQYRVGFCYYYGHGIERDESAAAKWFLCSAEHGHAVAQYCLGCCYYYGKGVDLDAKEAVRWFRKAAEHDESEAQNILGDCFFYGFGIKRDESAAVRWWRRSADLGNAAARKKITSFSEGVRDGSEAGDSAGSVKLFDNESYDEYESFNKELEEKPGYKEFIQIVEGFGCDKGFFVYLNKRSFGSVEIDYSGDYGYSRPAADKEEISEKPGYRALVEELDCLEAGFQWEICLYKTPEGGVKVFGTRCFSALDDIMNPFENAGVGDCVEFGRWPHTAEGEVQPVEWLLLAKEKNRALVISRCGIDARPFDGRLNDWGKSEIRSWLNGEFYNSAFTADEKALVKSFNEDYVFLLSKEEAEKYFSDDDARMCRPDAYAMSKGAYADDDGYGWWWLRSPDPDYGNFAYGVNCDGDIYLCSVHSGSGFVRPALWISLES